MTSPVTEMFGHSEEGGREEKEGVRGAAITDEGSKHAKGASQTAQLNPKIVNHVFVLRPWYRGRNWLI